MVLSVLCGATVETWADETTKHKCVQLKVVQRGGKVSLLCVFCVFVDSWKVASG